MVVKFKLTFEQNFEMNERCFNRFSTGLDDHDAFKGRRNGLKRCRVVSKCRSKVSLNFTIKM